MKLTLDVYHDVRQGGRQYMEDIISIVTNCDSSKNSSDENEEPFVCFYVFDGHGGVDAAKFAEKHLHQIITCQEGFYSQDDDVVLKAIRTGFIATHKLMWNVLDTWPRTHMGNHSTSGTTASMVMIRGAKMYVAHVGDSGVVVGEESGENETLWNAHCVTIDHKPDCPKEKQRIESIGGAVVLKAGVPRVVWKRERVVPGLPPNHPTSKDSIPFLAVARSLGDLWSYCKQNDAYYVSPNPDMCVHHLNHHSTKCIILASDGLWNAISPSDAVKLVKKYHDNSDNLLQGVCRDPASLLVGLALKKCGLRYIKADNTSAIVVLLTPPSVHHSPQTHSSPSSHLSPSVNTLSIHPSPSIHSSSSIHHSPSTNSKSSTHQKSSSSLPPNQSPPTQSSFSTNNSTFIQHITSTPPKLLNNCSSNYFMNIHPSISSCYSISTPHSSSFSSFPSSFNSSLFPLSYKSPQVVSLFKNGAENRHSLKICNGILMKGEKNSIIENEKISSNSSSSSSSSNSSSDSSGDDDVDDISDDSEVKDGHKYIEEVVINKTNDITSKYHIKNDEKSHNMEMDDTAERQIANNNVYNEVKSLESKSKVPFENNNKENMEETSSDAKSSSNVDADSISMNTFVSEDGCSRVDEGAWDLSVRFLSKYRSSTDSISSMTRLNDKLPSQPLYLTRSKLKQPSKPSPCTLPQISHFMTKPHENESISDKNNQVLKQEKENQTDNNRKSRGVVSKNNENDDSNSSHCTTDVLKEDNSISFSIGNGSHKENENHRDNNRDKGSKDDFNLLELCKAAYDDLHSFNDKPLPQQPVCFLDGLATGTDFNGQSSSLHRLTSDQVLSEAETCASNSPHNNSFQSTSFQSTSLRSIFQADDNKNHFCSYTMLKSKGFVKMLQKSQDFEVSPAEKDLESVNTVSTSICESPAKCEEEIESSDSDDDKVEDETPFTERLVENGKNLQGLDNEYHLSVSPLVNIIKYSIHNKRKSIKNEFSPFRKKSKLSNHLFEQLQKGNIEINTNQDSTNNIKSRLKQGASENNFNNTALSILKLDAVDITTNIKETSNINSSTYAISNTKEEDNNNVQNNDNHHNDQSPSSSPDNISLDDTDSSVLLRIEACA